MCILTKSEAKIKATKTQDDTPTSNRNNFRGSDRGRGSFERGGRGRGRGSERGRYRGNTNYGKYHQ